MNVGMDLICGISLGFEFVEAIPEEDIPRTLIVDILIFRFLIEW